MARPDVEPLQYGDGLYPVERDGDGPFYWTGPRFVLRRSGASRYLAIQLSRPDSGSALTVADSRALVARLDLARDWHWYSLDLGSAHGQELVFDVDRPLTLCPGGPLHGVMLRSVAWHDNEARHARIERARANQMLNEAEYRSGAVVLRSVPPYLRLTIEVRCNIANDKPCVYCAWKWMKREEIGAPEADLAFVESLGRYLDLAKVVNDCSYGEPPLHHQFADIVELIARDERAFSFASNGKTLRRKIRRALLGRNVFLYVSIDSASAVGYARYRDHSFNRIVADLRILCREKKAHANLPHVTVSFIVMQSNKRELQNFIGLMHSVGVDRVKLMSLGREHCMDLDGPVQQRGAFVFDYEKEMLSIEELEAVGNEARRLAAELGVDIYLDWQDFRAHHGPATGQPVCSEPWKTLYVLNRGIFPCCFGRKPVAHWSDRGNRSIGQFIDDTFNGATLQEMRGALATGTFPSYCLSTRSCPIVRKATADGASEIEPGHVRIDGAR